MNWLERKILQQQLKKLITAFQGGPVNFWKQYGPILVTLAGTLGAAIFTPQFIAAHPLAFAIVNMAAQLLHSVLPSVFQNPSSKF